MLVKYLRTIKYIPYCFLIFLFVGCHSEPIPGEILPKQLPNAIINKPYLAVIDINAGHNTTVNFEISPRNSGLQTELHGKKGYSIYNLYGTPKISRDIKVRVWGDGFSYNGKRLFDHTYILHVMMN